MTPVPWQRQTDYGGVRLAIQALRRLGVPDELLCPKLAGSRRRLYYRPRSASFWERIDPYAVLELARKLYRVQIVHLHPDRLGGSVHRARELNAAWQRVQVLFRAHGYQLGR